MSVGPQLPLGSPQFLASGLDWKTRGSISSFTWPHEKLWSSRETAAHIYSLQAKGKSFLKRDQNPLNTLTCVGSVAWVNQRKKPQLLAMTEPSILYYLKARSINQKQSNTGIGILDDRAIDSTAELNLPTNPLWRCMCAFWDASGHEC